jgi:hypothetical protein
VPTNNPDSNCAVQRGEVDLEWYAQRDQEWVALGIAAPARRALVNLKLYKLEDLQQITQTELAKAHGMGPKTMRELDARLKTAGLSFR